MVTGVAGATVGPGASSHYLLDTNHAGAILRSNAALLARLAATTGAEMGLCIPSIGELYYMGVPRHRPGAIPDLSVRPGRGYVDLLQLPSLAVLVVQKLIGFGSVDRLEGLGIPFQGFAGAIGHVS